MAFECQDDSNPNPPNNGTKPPPASNGGFCTTEREFKAFIVHDKTYLAKSYEKVEVIYHAFQVGAPRHYENLRGDRWDTVTDEAYPVVTSFDVITRGDAVGTNKIYRDRYVNVQYMCYPVMWSDGKNCVCFGERNAASVTSREEVTEEEY
ncbi:MAG TPA: hypothetical protein VIL74_00305 [Pyrinomonadaceae bacterium]